MSAHRCGMPVGRYDACGAAADCEAYVRRDVWHLCTAHGEEMQGNGHRVDGLNDEPDKLGEEYAREERELAERQWQEGAA